MVRSGDDSVLGETDVSSFDEDDDSEDWGSLVGYSDDEDKEDEDSFQPNLESANGAFWDEVVEPLTGASSDVTNALKQIRSKGISPIEALQRGCVAMFKRISGESKGRTRQDRYCTGGDLREGNTGRPSGERLNQARLVTSGLSNSLQVQS